MQILTVLAHPSPKSFNRSVAQMIQDVATQKDHQVTLCDLYAEKFNPILTDDDFEAFNRAITPADIQRMQDAVKAANVVAFIHPIWWFGVPAILKGWIDRVLSYGFAYGHDSRGVKPLLAGKKAIIVSTAGGAEAPSYGQNGFKDAMLRIYDDGIFRFVGFDIVFHRIFYEVPAKSESERREMLEVLREDLQKVL